MEEYDVFNARALEWGNYTVSHASVLEPKNEDTFAACRCRTFHLPCSGTLHLNGAVEVSSVVHSELPDLALNPPTRSLQYPSTDPVEHTRRPPEISHGRANRWISHHAGTEILVRCQRRRKFPPRCHEIRFTNQIMFQGIAFRSLAHLAIFFWILDAATLFLRKYSALEPKYLGAVNSSHQWDSRWYGYPTPRSWHVFGVTGEDLMLLASPTLTKVQCCPKQLCETRWRWFVVSPAKVVVHRWRGRPCVDTEFFYLNP